MSVRITGRRADLRTVQIIQDLSSVLGAVGHESDHKTFPALEEFCLVGEIKCTFRKQLNSTIGPSMVQIDENQERSWEEGWGRAGIAGRWPEVCWGIQVGAREKVSQEVTRMKAWREEGGEQGE